MQPVPYIEALDMGKQCNRMQAAQHYNLLECVLWKYKACVEKSIIKTKEGQSLLTTLAT